MTGLPEAPAFTFDWRAREHAQVSSLITRDFFSHGVWRVVGWVLIALVVGATALGVLAALGGEPSALISLAPWIALLALWLAVLWGGLGWMQAWQAQRQDPNNSHPYTHVFGPLGLQVKTRTTDIELKWEGVHKVRETSDYFLFYYNRRCAYYLPKRAVGEAAATDQLRTLIRQRIPPSVPFEVK